MSEPKRSPSARAIYRHNIQIVKKIWPQVLDFLANYPLVIWRLVLWYFRPKPTGQKWLYSLDFHPAVVADISFEMERHGVRVFSEVISPHNARFRKLFRRPDPVRGVNYRNWRKFDAQDVEKFQKHRKRLFSRFDGFIVSYPSSFVTLYREFGKPILVVNPIRYEHPFSNRPADWDGLDNQLESGIKARQITFFSNNTADAEYASHYLKMPIQAVPSICRYIQASWNPTVDLGLTYAHYTQIAEDFEHTSNGEWRALRNELGKKFSWTRLLRFRELFYIPYAPSTMLLFELATAGMPVAVPTLGFLKRLRSENQGVFGQLTFQEMAGRTPAPHRTWTANRYWHRDEYVEWWYQRSDFANEELMPNVRRVDSFAELTSSPSVPNMMGMDSYRKAIQERNLMLVERFDDAYSTFLSRLAQSA